MLFVGGDRLVQSYCIYSVLMVGVSGRDWMPVLSRVLQLHRQLAQEEVCPLPCFLCLAFFQCTELRDFAHMPCVLVLV